MTFFSMKCLSAVKPYKSNVESVLKLYKFKIKASSNVEIQYSKCYRTLQMFMLNQNIYMVFNSNFKILYGFEHIF